MWSLFYTKFAYHPCTVQSMFFLAPGSLTTRFLTSILFCVKIPQLSNIKNGPIIPWSWLPGVCSCGAGCLIWNLAGDLKLAQWAFEYTKNWLFWFSTPRVLFVQNFFEFYKKDKLLSRVELYSALIMNININSNVPFSKNAFVFKKRWGVFKFHYYKNHCRVNKSIFVKTLNWSTDP